MDNPPVVDEGEAVRELTTEEPPRVLDKAFRSCQAHVFVQE